MATLAELMPLVSSQQAAYHLRSGYLVYCKPDGSLWVLDFDSRPQIEYSAGTLEDVFAMLGDLVAGGNHWLLAPAPYSCS